jgi:hypothetical protein
MYIFIKYWHRNLTNGLKWPYEHAHVRSSAVLYLALKVRVILKSNTYVYEKTLRFIVLHTIAICKVTPFLNEMRYLNAVCHYMKKTYPSIPGNCLQLSMYNDNGFYKSKMSTLSENVISVYVDWAAVGTLRKEHLHMFRWEIRFAGQHIPYLG